MSHIELARIIDDAFERRESIGPATTGEVRRSVEAALDLLDRGEARVAQKPGAGDWQVNAWLKKAVLLSFRLQDMSLHRRRPRRRGMVGQGRLEICRLGRCAFPDRRLSRSAHCVVRRSAYIAPGVVLMPCFVNLGAYVDCGHHD